MTDQRRITATEVAMRLSSIPDDMIELILSRFDQLEDRIEEMEGCLSWLDKTPLIMIVGDKQEPDRVRLASVTAPGDEPKVVMAPNLRAAIARSRNELDNSTQIH